MEVSNFTSPKYAKQMTLIGTKHDPHATEWMDIAIADLFLVKGSLSV